MVDTVELMAIIKRGRSLTCLVAINLINSLASFSFSHTSVLNFVLLCWLVVDSWRCMLLEMKLLNTANEIIMAAINLPLVSSLLHLRIALWVGV